jgi:pyruvate/2-oxoglutarate dehydrogenase complex dihydrolipoamide dehydrogenase (E3) component
MPQQALASIMLEFGAQVDLVAAADRLVPQSDANVSRGLKAAFAARGMHVLTATRSAGHGS